jgi:hypothetical protein
VRTNEAASYAYLLLPPHVDSDRQFGPDGDRISHGIEWSRNDVTWIENAERSALVQALYPPRRTLVCRFNI